MLILQANFKESEHKNFSPWAYYNEIYNSQEGPKINLFDATDL